MTGPSDFTDEELIWLAKAERSIGVTPPEKVEDKLICRGVADRTNLGLKITGLGSTILDEARCTGRSTFNPETNEVTPFVVDVR